MFAARDVPELLHAAEPASVNFVSLFWLSAPAPSRRWHSLSHYDCRDRRGLLKMTTDDLVVYRCCHRLMTATARLSLCSRYLL